MNPILTHQRIGTSSTPLSPIHAIHSLLSSPLSQPCSLYLLSVSLPPSFIPYLLTSSPFLYLLFISISLPLHRRFNTPLLHFPTPSSALPYPLFSAYLPPLIHFPIPSSPHPTPSSPLPHPLFSTPSSQPPLPPPFQSSRSVVSRQSEGIREARPGDGGGELDGRHVG